MIQLHAQLQQAIAKHNAGMFTDAHRIYETILAQQPAEADVYFMRGITYWRQGEVTLAIDSVSQAINYHADRPQYYKMLIDILIAAQQKERAVECGRQGMANCAEGSKEYNDLLATTAMALQMNNQPEEAIALFRRATIGQPTDINMLHNYAVALQTVGCLQEAAEIYQKRSVLLRSTKFWGDPQYAQTRHDHQSFDITHLAKLRHDISQFSYLVAQGVLPTSFIDVIKRYQEVYEEIAATGVAKGQFVFLTADQRQKIGEYYNRIVHFAPAPAHTTTPINPKIDVKEIEDRYLQLDPGITWVDDLLTPQALHDLRRFCLESTIWFDTRHVEGYLGAYVYDGFNAPLLLQIAEELQRKFPKVFGQHHLMHMWAYKYDSQMTGIAPHADMAAVNVNFWIAPDGDCLDHDHGGLVVYKKEAPVEWDFYKYNNDQQAIADFLAEHGDDHVIVPHRQNRAVIFNSNLLHKTDDFKFRDAYTSRRINITLLYGLRPGFQFGSH